MRHVRSWLSAALAVGLTAAVSVGVAFGSGHRTERAHVMATAAAVPHGSVLSGPGYTVPTTGTGKRIKGGTVYFAEPPGQAPNYIFPMIPPQFYELVNATQIIPTMFLPLYWYGDNYSMHVDYGSSIGKKPVASNGGRTYTIHLNPYRWSDGEHVTAEDIVFWMNMIKANPQVDWGQYAKGFFPDNVRSYRAVSPQAFQITFRRAYNPNWVLYNELSQITPLPLAWDRTSLSAPVPKRLAGSIGGTVKGAGEVWNFLNQRSKDLPTWGTSPLWKVADGPFKVNSLTNTGRLTLVANRQYSGSPKPSIDRLVYLPFTSDATMFNLIKASGPSAVTVGYLPEADQPQAASVAAEGYDLNHAAVNEVSFFELNFNNPSIGPVVQQLYFRQAFQRMINQPGWIRAFLHGTALPTYSVVPTGVDDPFLSTGGIKNPYPFSLSAAKKLLVDHGWAASSGGTLACKRAGTGPSDCGAGVKKGTKLTFSINYLSGNEGDKEEMENLQQNARQVGMNIFLESHSFSQVIGAEGLCTPKQAFCAWQGANWGNGYDYQDVLPTAEMMVVTGATISGNNYSSSKMNATVNAAITAKGAQFGAKMQALAQYTAQQLPIFFIPTQEGTFNGGAGTLVSKKLGGYTANADGYAAPQFWYLTK